MKKEIYKINYFSQSFEISKSNNELVGTINLTGSPTGNCQLFSIHNFNLIEKLTNEQISEIIDRLSKIAGKRLFIIEISKKTALNKFYKFIEESKSKYIIVQNNNFNVNKNRISNSLLIRKNI